MGELGGEGCMPITQQPSLQKVGLTPLNPLQPLELPRVRVLAAMKAGMKDEGPTEHKAFPLMQNIVIRPSHLPGVPRSWMPPCADSSLYHAGNHVHHAASTMDTALPSVVSTVVPPFFTILAMRASILAMHPL